MINSLVVTGATSSLGLALIEECVKQKIRVLALVNPGSKKIKYIVSDDLIEVCECSLEQLKYFEYDREYDAFVHFAWASTSGDAARDLLLPQALNIQYALDAVNLAKRLGCDIFVGAGSQAEYGRHSSIIDESSLEKPESAYGMAKLCAGQMTRLACKQQKIKHIWPRIFSAYGPYCQPQSVINYTILELLNNRSPNLSLGEQVWDFIYTGDVAKAYLMLIDKGIDGEVYNIGYGKSECLKDYLKLVGNLINPNVELGFGKIPYNEKTVMHLECNNKKIIDTTGFVPTTSFEEGIKITTNWIQNQLLV